MDKITAIITDLDNTLWKEIIAEKQTAKLNKDYYNFLIDCYKKGIQLFIVSRNDKKDVLETLNKLNLNKNKFTMIIANWEPKYLNIERLIYQTQLRPETIAFVDDNVLERNE